MHTLNSFNKSSKILVTGGTGFIGSAFANSLKNDYDIILTSRNIGLGVKNSASLYLPFLPMDLTSYSSVSEVIRRVKPDIIIHAAASKFIDVSELNPSECIESNILGSLNLAKVAVENNVHTVIGISTDKAASPFNSIYGQSKLAMEQIFSRFSTFSNVNFKCVRFGNVAWSTGSVLPIWWNMFKETNVVKSSGYNMKRFMMDCDSAVNCICDTINFCSSGSTFVEDMKWLNISDLLHNFVSLYGGKFEIIDKRFADANAEILISEPESFFSTKVNINQKDYFIINRFNNLSNTSFSSAVTIENSKQLSQAEIINILNSKPTYYS